MPQSAEGIVVSLLILLLLSVGIPSILVRREQARKLQMDERLKNVGLGPSACQAGSSVTRSRSFATHG